MAGNDRLGAHVTDSEDDEDDEPPPPNSKSRESNDGGKPQIRAKTQDIKNAMQSSSSSESSSESDSEQRGKVEKQAGHKHRHHAQQGSGNDQKPNTGAQKHRDMVSVRGVQKGKKLQSTKT